MGDLVQDLRSMPSSLNDAMRTMEIGADEIERLRSTVDVLESNARVQAKLLADTGRERDAMKAALSQAYEECAKICDDIRHEDYSAESEDWIAGTAACAAAIKSRGQE